MMEFWNKKDLPPPPVTSCKSPIKEIDMRLLDITLREAVNFFDNQQHLSLEGALLSRAIYRFKMKFRSSKDFKIAEKIHRCLRVYLQMDMSRILKTLTKQIPPNYKANKTPVLTKNMLDYVLVRLQGLGKTLYTVLETCKQLSVQMQLRLKLGHFWKIAFLVVGMIGRIFVIAKSILKYSCELYGNLRPFSSTLKNSGVDWLPEHYELPSRLDEWLDIDWLHFDDEVIEIADDAGIDAFLKLVESDDDDVEFCDEYIMIKDDDSKDFLTIEDDAEEDIGEVVDVDELASLKRKWEKTPESDDEVVELDDKKGEKKQPKKKFKKKFKQNVRKINKSEKKTKKKQFINFKKKKSQNMKM